MQRNHTIILFDGVCNLCNSTVRFVIKRDSSGHFRFAALQTEVGRRLCAEHGVAITSTAAPDSIVVLQDGRALLRSDAALAIAARLPLPWSLLRAFRIVPRALRDLVYRLIAHNRARWFGRRDTCMVPTNELRARFLE